MESNTNQNITGGGATEVAGAAGATNQEAVTGQSVPTTSSATNVAEQNVATTSGQNLVSELEKELETTLAVDAGPEPEPAPVKSKKKGGSGLIFAMVFVTLLAAGGIGFGVWAMMDGNQQKEELNSQISSLRQSNSELQARLSETNTIDDCANSDECEGKTTVNPVIVPSEPNKEYSLTFMSLNGVSSEKGFQINYRNGAIKTCEVGYNEGLEGGGFTFNGKECSVNGLSGEIYQIIRFGAGHDGSNDNIGFIMTDGTVWYAPLAESAESEEIKVKKLGINGKVVDVTGVSVHNAPDAYGATVFILDNGSIVEYSESLLQQ